VSPYLKRSARAGERRCTVVIPPQPDNRQMFTTEACEPAVTLVVGGTGFTGQRQRLRELIVDAAPGTFAQYHLQGVLQLEGAFQRETLLQLQRVTPQGLAIGGQYFTDRAQRRVDTFRRQGVINTRHFE